MNRELILINGALDNQSEWLGSELAQEQYSQLFVEHISGKKIARSLGHSALSSLNSVALYDAMSRSLSGHDSANVVLISNYPQHLSQIDDIYELAMLDDRRMAGLIIPDNQQADAILQILADNPTPLTAADAAATLQRYYQNLDPIILELRYRDLPLQFVNMSQPEPAVIRDAVHRLQYFISSGDADEERFVS